MSVKYHNRSFNLKNPPNCAILKHGGTLTGIYMVRTSLRFDYFHFIFVAEF